MSAVPNALRPFVDANDRLLVIEAGANAAWYGMPSDVGDWCGMPSDVGDCLKRNL